MHSVRCVPKTKSTAVLGARSMSLWSFVKEIRQEWKENEKATEPMANPSWQDGRDVPLHKKVLQPFSSHRNSLKEAVKLYKMSLPFQDHNTAVRETKIKENLLKQLIDERTGRVHDDSQEGKKFQTKLDAIETDVMAMTEKIRALVPEDLPKDRDEAIDFIKNKKGDVRELAVDRLEVMGASISEFMGGYRQGKQDGMDYIFSPEGDKYFASLDGLEEEINKDLSASKKERVSGDDDKVRDADKDAVEDIAVEDTVKS